MPALTVFHYMLLILLIVYPILISEARRSRLKISFKFLILKNLTKMRREGRKAATQALVVIAESIRASRGRRSAETPVLSRDNSILEKANSWGAQGGYIKEEMVPSLGKQENSKRVITRNQRQEARSNSLSLASHSQSNKENVRPPLQRASSEAAALRKLSRSPSEREPHSIKPFYIKSGVVVPSDKSN
jgi:hypothetical protein